MTGFGLIGTGAALLNYRKAQANLEEVKERRDTIITGLKTYQQYLEELNEWQQEVALQAELDAIKVDEVNNPEGLQVTTILRVANLVGKYYKAKISVLFSNITKDQVFEVEEISSTCYFKDKAIASVDYVYLAREELAKNYYIPYLSDEAYEHWKKVNKLDTILIRPGQTVEKEFDEQTRKLPELAEEMRDYITAYCGKSLITSCPKVSIDNKIENANIMFTWRNAKLGSLDLLDSEKYKTAVYRAKPGVLRYCGEAGLK